MNMTVLRTVLTIFLNTTIAISSNNNPLFANMFPPDNSPNPVCELTVTNNTIATSQLRDKILLMVAKDYILCNNTFHATNDIYSCDDDDACAENGRIF